MSVTLIHGPLPLTLLPEHPGIRGSLPLPASGGAEVRGLLDPEQGQ